jgi:3-oxoacyl-[acyl-carrier protein] reductase
MKRLQGKAALITGGGSGIGRAQAIRFAREGATVIVADVNAETAASVAAEVQRAGGIAFAAQVDITDRSDIERCVSAAIKQAGRINILSNTAGVMDGKANILETTPELWEKVLAINLGGMFNMTKALVPHMIAQGGGVVLNISSGAGFLGGLGGTAYTSAKHGVIGFTRQLAAEFGRKGIRSVGISPGLIDTPMVAGSLSDPAFATKAAMRPAGRIGTPDDIANAALFLVSDESDFIHGVTLPVDGGRLAVA